MDAPKEVSHARGLGRLSLNEEVGRQLTDEDKWTGDTLADMARDNKCTRIIDARGRSEWGGGRRTWQSLFKVKAFSFPG